MKRGVVGRLVVVALGAVVLAGCSAQGEPMPSAGTASGDPTSAVKGLRSPSIAPVEVPVAVEVPAGLPSLARTNTIQGGVAVAIAFVEEHPRLFQEGPSELFAFLSMAECEYCAYEQERALREGVELGLQVGGDMVVDRSDPYFKLDAEEFGEPTLAVVLDVYEQPYTFVNGAGEVTRSGDGQQLKFGVALQLRDGIWRVLHFDFEEVEPVEVPPEILELLEEHAGG